MVTDWKAEHDHELALRREWSERAKNAERKLATIKAMVDEQAEDEGLWFRAQRMPEAYLQQALRRLHEAIEEKTSEQCAVELLTVNISSMQEDL